MDLLPCLGPSKGRRNCLNIHAHGHRSLRNINRNIWRISVDNDRHFCGYYYRLYRF